MKDKDYILSQHEKYQGKIETKLKISLSSKEDLAVFYSPGIAQPCLAINDNPLDVYKYTNKGNTIAIISDGSAILGLGNIGPLAGLPVMECKAAVLKHFANVDVMPICVASQDIKEIIQFCKLLEPSVAGIMLEDIAAPRCVEIERALEKELNIPVFHDDQHGTAIITCSALLNSLKLVNKKMDEIKVIVSGTGAAGSAIIKLLHHMGVKNILAYNIKGVVSNKNPQYKTYNFLSLEIMELLNLNNYYVYNEGTLSEALEDADVFIGVSVAGLLTEQMVKSMAKDSIIFALANPSPEIEPSLALSAGAKIIGTGRSDYPNQINNVLAFPGIFRGLLDCRAKNVTIDAKLAVIKAIADSVKPEDLNVNNILPNVLDLNVTKAVAKAVKDSYNK